MRIGIDARFFGPRQTGLGRYVERLVTHLQAVDHTNDYVLFLRREAYERWQPSNPRWTKILADCRWYTIREQLVMPFVFLRQRLDLLHVPHFNVPVMYPKKFVVTIHDLILDQFPTERASTLEPFIFWIKFTAYKFGVWNAIRRARQVITVSDHSRQDVIRRFHKSPSEVTVTYESVDPLPPSAAWAVLHARGVQAPYLLHVGNSYPHKNLERLLAAWRAIATTGLSRQLVLVGHSDYFSRRLQEYAKRQNISNVLWYGFSTDEELAALYERAQAYVFPSLSEGFGLPGLEAMQAGIPVIAARASCLPEIFADAAEYFNPHDPVSIATSIERVLRDTLVRQRLVAAGRERLRNFSWRTMAAETLTLYESTVTNAKRTHRPSS